MGRTIALGRRRIALELRQFFRDRESALFNFMLPMILLVIFGSVFAEQQVGFGDVTFSQYFLAGMIASGILYTSFQNLAIAIPMERDDATLKRLQGLPMPKASYFIGKAGMVFTAYIAQVVILLVVGVLFFGVNLPDSAAKWLTQAMRYVFLPDGAQVIEASGSWDLGMCALVLGAWTIAGFLIAIKVFRWAPRGSGG